MPAEWGLHNGELGCSNGLNIGFSVHGGVQCELEVGVGKFLFGDEELAGGGGEETQVPRQ